MSNANRKLSNMAAFEIYLGITLPLKIKVDTVKVISNIAMGFYY